MIFKKINIFIAIFILSGCGQEKNDNNNDEKKNNSNSIKRYPLKKTGQSKSYNRLGSEIVDGSLKDDGFYQKGITPIYLRDYDNNIVEDKITKLMWEDSENSQLMEMNEAINYCSNLALNNFKDWRVPSIQELQTIVVYNQNPSIDNDYFINTYPSYYWSSSYGLYKDKEGIWTINFERGSIDFRKKDSKAYIRCVKN